ncbi:sulfite exporter TauE/SafE family protein [Alicyclobacillus tolerans]|uniref:sulfite exporter TauE/SafE family protein n=1 Tax=Alicyclobacillus tolerans TaxID=90970 RepID=UPI001F275B9B|nr:sulfite exporter TauE/SafE family protein [Alicyclobacillus tolerans]MCF8565895.1 sulfite exporter TauE/SafE family protein [Alicyclobacillus tolerans]
MTHAWLIILIAVIVGFVTTYLKITIDRIFLVLLLVLWMGFGIQQAVVINALVMLLASLLFFRGARRQLSQFPGKIKWSVVILSFIGGIFGRWIGLHTSSRGLLLILGIYAVLIGLRLLLIKPKMVPDGKMQAGVSVVTFLFSILTGLISAGGKPLQIPVLVKGFKLSMPQAYLVASLGTIASTVGFITGELWFTKVIPLSNLAWSWIYFVGISLVMYIFEPLWNAKAQKWVTLLVGVLLTAVGIKLVI